MYKKNFHIHFIGMGGIGMSALAQLLAKQGYTVSGSDSNQNQKTITDCQKAGCTLISDNAYENAHIDLFVYSTAIKPDNPALTFARKHTIATAHRSEILAELMRTKFGIAIAGSHGKTTTSSLVAHVLLEAGLDPSIAIGGHLNRINNNSYAGSGEFFVVEADESDRSMLNLSPALSIVTNIDLEHLETYQNLQDVTHTFKKFLDKLPCYGKAILCTDSEQVKALLPLKKNKAITYGIDAQADWTAKNIVHAPDYSTFDAYFKNNLMGSVRVALPGIHNVTNALSVLAVSKEIGISFEKSAKALASFTGVDRRFTFKGTCKGASIFDDYGHHPLEIKHTLETAQRKTKGKIMMLFQPHRYTRTYKLWDDFVDLFTKFPIDHLVITDIYEASEDPVPGVTSQNLVEAVKAKCPSLEVYYIPVTSEFSELKQHFSSTLSQGDLLILQGAGRVNSIYAQLIEE